MQCLFWYVLLKKKQVLVTLFSKNQDEKIAKLLSNDFSLPRWKTASINNAYALITKKLYLEAAGFFLLGGNFSDAVNVIVNSLQDI